MYSLVLEEVKETEKINASMYSTDNVGEETAVTKLQV